MDTRTAIIINLGAPRVRPIGSPAISLSIWFAYHLWMIAFDAKSISDFDLRLPGRESDFAEGPVVFRKHV